MAYSAYILTESSRNMLLGKFPPKYEDVIAHHITHMMGDHSEPEPKTAKVIGYMDDEVGLETLLVALDGKLSRPDKRVYHITWSIDRSKGYRPVDSNSVIRTKTMDYQNWSPYVFDHSIPIDVIPKYVR